VERWPGSRLYAAIRHRGRTSFPCCSARNAIERAGVGRFTALVLNGDTLALLFLFTSSFWSLVVSRRIRRNLYRSSLGVHELHRQLQRNRGWSSMYRPSRRKQPARSRRT